MGVHGRPWASMGRVWVAHERSTSLPPMAPRRFLMGLRGLSWNAMGLPLALRGHPCVARGSPTGFYGSSIGVNGRPWVTHG